MSLDGWKRASFLVGSESNVRQWEPLPGAGPCCLGVAEAPFVSLHGWKRLVWEPLPGGSVRPSGRCCFAVAEAPFVSLDGWKRASFLVGSESNVRQWEPLPGGSVRPSGPCCLGVAEAPFVSLHGWKRASLGAVARRLGPSFRALLFCCGEGAVCEP